MIKKYKVTIIGLVAGAFMGWLYWSKIGCSSGTCMITSNPINSSLYGALIGALIADSIQKKENVKTNSTIQNNSNI